MERKSRIVSCGMKGLELITRMYFRLDKRITERKNRNALHRNWIHKNVSLKIFHIPEILQAKLRNTNPTFTIKICLLTHEPNLAVSLEMLSPHRIVNSGTISHNILYIPSHKHKRVAVMTTVEGRGCLTARYGRRICDRCILSPLYSAT